MQIEVGIVLIVIGFMIPVVGFFVYRKVRAARLKSLKGEIFDKECDFFDIEKEGKTMKIVLQNRKFLQNSQAIVQKIGLSKQITKKPKGETAILYFFEDVAKRKLKVIPNIQDISVDLHQIPSKQQLTQEKEDEVAKEQQQIIDNSDIKLELRQLEPEENENAINNQSDQHKFEDKDVGISAISANQQSNNYNHTDTNQALDLMDESANDLKIEITNMSKFNNRSNNKNNNNDRSLMINPDLSDILNNPSKTPEFQNKPVVNYYENESEDLSMLKEIMSQRSEKGNNNDISIVSRSQPKYFQPSPFKKNDISILNNSHLNDKSTDCIMSQKVDRFQQHQIITQKNQQLLQVQQQNSSNKQNLQMSIGKDDSSVDINAFDEKLQTQEKQPYFKSANKQQDRTKKLFYRQPFARPQQVYQETLQISSDEDEKMIFRQDLDESAMIAEQEMVKEMSKKIK
ncbi:UNKNOWN [Stylonychia lemnae]|uniref:Transmembrane protein n=1 Tax=Stylonychia lemnae TaxID=5949 RepID=A0A078AR27_STYLE|nr:UNKNOWN [Stylonychia lemnae]|eukprot:CDW84416.1 UNKNOWN [Stylonychia lemnae]